MRARARRVVFWGIALLLAVLAGGLAFAYTYVTDSSTLADLIRREAPRFFPGSTLHVGRVELRPFLGQVKMNQIRLSQRLDGRAFPTAQIAWMSVFCDLRALTQGRFEPSEIALTQPILRLQRRADGTLNLEGLLAEPWPGPPLTVEPLVRVKGGTLELYEEGRGDPTKLLIDVELTAKPNGGGLIAFDGSARGGAFDRVQFEGTFDRRSGRVELTKGSMTRLVLTESLEPVLGLTGVRDRFARVGLHDGEADLTLKRLVYDPAATPALSYEGSARLRGATLDREELPFRLSDVAGMVRLERDRVVVESAEGRDGKTVVRIHGEVAADDPAGGPFDLTVNVIELELDERLRAKTPPEYAFLWREYRPEGWIDLGVRLARPAAGAPVGFGMSVRFRDVGVVFHEFPLPLRHIHGMLKWEGNTLDVDLQCLLAGEPLRARGTVTEPGPRAVVRLDFTSERMAVDEQLLRALPRDIRAVVEGFRPTGSVRGVAHLTRRPPPRPGTPDEVVIHAELDLNEGCSMRWDGMPYLVRDMTGHLDLRPDRWTFTNLRGRNGIAEIELNGQVVGAQPGRQEIDLTVEARRLPFDQQLREALPPQWQATWATLNPSGRSEVKARIEAEPGEEPHYHLEIVPEPAETRLHLAITPVEGSAGLTGRPAGVIELPSLEKVSGQFRFDDGAVTMSGVKFLFREAPVQVDGGRVELRGDGGFELAVRDLLVTKLKLDAELRRVMPPVMAQFAQRLDDGKPFWVRGDLGIGWSGKPGEPARCAWRNATVVLDGNAIQTGLPLEQIHGQIDHLSGWSDGRDIEVHGIVNLDSIRLLGQYVTGVSTPLDVKDGQAVLGSLKGTLLGGTLYARVGVSLEDTPHYEAALQLHEADLGQYARTLSGKQPMRGLVSGELEVEGEGNELRSSTGRGWARVTQADLGELPAPLRLVKVGTFSPPTKTAFDSAEIRGDLDEGRLVLSTIRLTGDAVSLAGTGTVKLQNEHEVDLHLQPFYGRDERRVPVLSELVRDPLREAVGRAIDLHVTGPLTALKIAPEPLPDVLRATEGVRRRAERRSGERSRRP